MFTLSIVPQQPLSPVQQPVQQPEQTHTSNDQHQPIKEENLSTKGTKKDTHKQPCSRPPLGTFRGFCKRTASLKQLLTRLRTCRVFSRYRLVQQPPLVLMGRQI